MANYLIATYTAPGSADAARSVNQQLRDNAALVGLTIPPGIVWTPSTAGCVNLAFALDGPDPERERFVAWLTMELMPARWTTTRDALPADDTYNLV